MERYKVGLALLKETLQSVQAVFPFHFMFDMIMTYFD